MATSASRPKPKAKRQVRKTRYTCPACGNVALFSTGEVMQCPACGHYASDDEPLVPVAHLATPPATPATAPAPAPAALPREAPVGLAVTALLCGLLALFGLWGSPLSLLLAIAAVATGSVALSQNPGDGAVQAMGVIGVVLGGLSLLGILLFASLFWDDSSDWEWDWDWGWWDAPEEPDRRDEGINVGIPGPSALVALVGLLAAALTLRLRGSH